MIIVVCRIQERNDFYALNSNIRKSKYSFGISQLLNISIEWHLSDRWIFLITVWMSSLAWIMWVCDVVGIVLISRHVCKIVRLVIKTSLGWSGEFLLPPTLVTTDGCHSPPPPPAILKLSFIRVLTFYLRPGQRSHLAVIAKLLMGRNEKQRVRQTVSNNSIFSSASLNSP